MQKFIGYVLWLILVSFPELATSQYRVKPFYVHNQSPVVHFWGFPNNEGGELALSRQWFLSGRANLVNNASSKHKIDEDIYLDGEMFRFDLSFRYGLSNRVELGFDIPLVRHSSGVLDPFISSWHGTFNLPQVARSFMPLDDINYRYRVDGETRIMMNKSYLGFGDISVRGAFNILQDRNHVMSFRSSLKFPTGNKDRLIGSGSVDCSIHINGTHRSIWASRSGHLFYSGGLLFIGGGSLLEEAQQRVVCFGSLGYAFQFFDKIYPKFQLDYHSSLNRESQIRQMGMASLQLAFGVDLRINCRSGLEVGMVEDLAINTAPDIVFHLGYTRYF